MSMYQEKTIREFLTLTQALKLLPGIAPNKSKPLIEDAHHFSFDFTKMDVEHSYFKIGATEISEQEWEEMWIEDVTYYGTTIRISPRGAKTLLKLYLKGDLILKKGKSIVLDIPLKEYIEQEELFDRKNEERIEASKRWHMLVENPYMIKEADFKYDLLDSVFVHFNGLTGSSQTMVIDGIEVTKSVYGYNSNSGKTRDYEVVISWIGSDGQRQELRKNSIYKDNRRNDSNRNWGLPE